MSSRGIAVLKVHFRILAVLGLLALTAAAAPRVEPSFEVRAAAPVARFSGYPTKGQAPLRVQFTDRSTPAGAITKWHWVFGDGTESHEKNPKNLFEEPGTYSVKLTVTAEGGTNTREEKGYIVVTEGTPPKVDFLARPTTGQAPLKVNFVNRSQGATSYEWTFGDNEVSTRKNPAHVYKEPGRYSVSLTATGPGGVASKVMDDYISVTASNP